MTITVEEISDLQKLPKLGLETIVDPMVFRCGELFQKGANGVADPYITRDLLRANIHTIGLFFDCLILNEKLPVFNYGDTFDSRLNFEQRVLTQINDFANEEVLYDVDVRYNAYETVKSAAIAELMKVLVEQPNTIQQSVFQDLVPITSELTMAEYNWNPSLGGMKNQFPSVEQERIATFFLGGLIFNGYAQIMEGDHLLQPKRSRLLLAAALQAPSSDYKLQETLFSKLKEKANTPCEDLPWRPTFFPYLIDKANTPTELLKEVVRLRRSGEVADYRTWLKEVMQDWKKKGKISIEKRNDVKDIAQRVERKISGDSSLPKVEVKVTVADVTTLKPPGAIDFTPTLSSLWGWFFASLPGQRYRKLLTRAIAADYEYVELSRGVENVWKAG